MGDSPPVSKEDPLKELICSIPILIEHQTVPVGYVYKNEVPPKGGGFNGWFYWVSGDWAMCQDWWLCSWLPLEPNGKQTPSKNGTYSEQTNALDLIVALELRADRCRHSLDRGSASGANRL